MVDAQAQRTDTDENSAAEASLVDIVLTAAGSHPDAVAAKLFDLNNKANGTPGIACSDLMRKASEILPASELQAGIPLAELARQRRDQFAELFRSQLPRALAFAATAQQAEGASIILRGLGALVQLSPSDPTHATPWQSQGDVFDLVLSRDGRSIETLTEIRRLTGLGYARAKELVAKLPQPIKVGLSEAEAENLGRLFDNLGAEVELVRRQTTPTRPVTAGAVGRLQSIDFTGIEEATKALLEEPEPFEVLRSIRMLYTTRIRAVWHNFVDEAEVFASKVRLAKEAEEQGVRSEADRAVSIAEQSFADDVAEDNKSLEKMNGELRTFIDESTAYAKRIWDNRGAALELSQPEAAIAGRRWEGTETSPVGDFKLAAAHEAYEAAKSIAGAFQPMEPFEKDKTVRKFLTGAGWAAGILFVILWASSGFLFGLILAGLLFAGVMMIPIHTRSKAAEAYNQLLDATINMQRLRELDVKQHGSAVAARIEARRSKLNKEKQTIAGQTAEKLAAVNAKYDQHAQAGRNTFATSRQACTATLTRLAATIEQAVANRHANYAPLDDEGVAVPSSEMAFADRTRFRFGRSISPQLAEPNPDAIKVLGLGGELAQPLRLTADVPVFWEFSSKRSLFVADSEPATSDSDNVIKVLLARILHQIPPGKVNFTLFDPIGLGRNFSEFLKLADYSDQLINGRVWSDREHIRRKLKDLIEHIETVTQKYLRNDFPDIETYNEKAGEIAEPYRVLVVADFPESFDEETARDLVRIVQNGPRCGVFAILHANLAQKMPHGIELDALKPFCIEMIRNEDRNAFSVAFSGKSAEARGPQEAALVAIDTSASEGAINGIVAQFGGGAQQAMRVEVPYQKLLGMASISEDSWWQRSSAGGIEIPLGPTGAKKVQTLRLGMGLAHHALVVGRPGSGKSNLIHVFITMAGRLYAPDEVQLYLIDFKKGVEFKCYAEAKLPHARVIAVESEREFGLSVLEGLDAELKKRGEKFRSTGSANISEHRAKTREKLPRIVLVVDEFQEFFTRDDRIKREATVLFDRLVRQGRAFGIHLILGTQSLANAGLERATQDQMAVRIALQCSEADSRLILGEDNTAARLLTRPGEAIYNDAAGLLEGNNLFQVAMFSEDDRVRELAAISENARGMNWQGDPPIVFEGHEPAQIAMCKPLATCPTPSDPNQVKTIQLWLGEPTSLRPTIAVPLKRQSGRNFMVLTRDEEQGVGVVLACLLSLAAQLHPQNSRFAIVDLTSADATWADHPEEFAAAVPHSVEVLGRRDLKSLLPELNREVARRSEGGLMKESSVILVLLGLQRARELRQSDGASPFSLSMDLNSDDAETSLLQCVTNILREGPEVGLHTLIWCDTYANLDRALDRSSVNEIGLRVSGPLSAQESHRIFDDEIASLIDKPHRMLKYDDDQVGAFELFRPYGVMSVEYIANFGKSLKDGVDAK